jgi:hypothetical protein
VRAGTPDACLIFSGYLTRLKDAFPKKPLAVVLLL